MKKPVMTLSEVVQDLRAIGMKTNATVIADGIEEGIYPFGRILGVGASGRRHIQIFRNDFERWKSAVLLGDGKGMDNFSLIDRGNWNLVSSHTFTQQDKDVMWEVIIRSWTKQNDEGKKD